MINVNGTGFEVYNNTIVGADVGGDLCFNVGRPSGSPTIKFRNNIVTGCNTLLLTQNSPVIQAWDNNVYGQCTASGCNSGTPFVLNGGAAFDTFTQWRAACGCDASSQYGASMTFASLGSSGQPQAGSPTINIAANLSGLNYAPLNWDTSAGGTRSPTARVSGTCSAPGQATCWTAGAYNSGSGSGVTPPTAPTGLAATAR
jgi:hypothetical protein